MRIAKSTFRVWKWPGPSRITVVMPPAQGASAPTPPADPWPGACPAGFDPGHTPPRRSTLPLSCREGRAVLVAKW